MSTAASALALGGCSSLGIAAKRPEPDFIWSYLAHFGINSWKDIPLGTQDPAMKESWLLRCCADHVRFSEASWRRISAALAKAGCNQIVIDLAEIVQYPSHPELAVKDSWSVEKLRAELDRLRAMGFEVIPKMNFSATHDTWLKDYVTEKAGCRPWIWSDYSWKHKDEFLKRMPRSVLQSNWHYGAEFDATKLATNRYIDLDKAGFDQIPTGSNFSCDTNFAGLVKFCDAHCSKDRIKGYMMAPWTRTVDTHEAKALEAVAQMESVIKARKS